jgi:hypothetical protein
MKIFIVDKETYNTVDEKCETSFIDFLVKRFCGGYLVFDNSKDILVNKLLESAIDHKESLEINDLRNPTLITEE